MYRIALLLGLLFCQLIPLRAFGAAGSKEEKLNDNKGSFIFRDDKGNPAKPVTVWYYKPAKLPANAKIVFVMHGKKRNGEEYRDHWADYCAQQHCLLLVPEFAERDYSVDEYQFGNVRDPNPEHWSFALIEHLFDFVRERELPGAQQYFLYGHSAGAQFVHRFMLFMPNPRVELAIAANAGAWTMARYPQKGEAPFPWTLDPALVTQARLKTLFARPLVVMLGDQDIDPHHPALPRAPEAMAQGRFRLERGQNFFRSAQAEAHAHQVPFKWRLQIVPGVAHSDSGMGKAAVKVFFP